MMPIVRSRRHRHALIHLIADKETSRKFVLRVGLLLDQRLCWLSCGYRVCMSVHNLPLTFFGSKDHRSPKSPRADIFASADLGLAPLYLHHIGKLRGCVLRYGLKASAPAISDRRRSTLHILSNLLPPSHGR